MKCKIIELDLNAADPTVELRFSVASERADGAELLRVNAPSTDNEKEDAKLLSLITKTLKQMKSEKLIQFFATNKSFKISSTEAEFLINKYPDEFSCVSEETVSFFYIKI